MKDAARKGDEERRQEKDAVPEQAGIRTAEQEDAVKQDKELKIGKLDDTVYDRAIRKRLAAVWAHAEAEEISRSLPLEGDDLNYVLRSVSRISGGHAGRQGSVSASGRRVHHAAAGHIGIGASGTYRSDLRDGGGRGSADRAGADGDHQGGERPACGVRVSRRSHGREA